ncbi:MAG: V-type ATPase subunit [Candidatus Hodarchaeales archaeon]
MAISTNFESFNVQRIIEEKKSLGGTLLAGSTNQGYIAARFYGMRSQLLKNDDYSRFLAPTDISSYISELRNYSIYKTPLEERLLLEHPLTAIDNTINFVLSERMKKVLRIVGESYYQGFKLLSLKWELANIQLAIRSILRQTEFRPYFIPLGDLNHTELAFLANCTDLNEALSYLESILNPLAQVVRQIIEKNVPKNDLETIDGIFNQFYQDQLRRGLKKIGNSKIRNIMKKTIKQTREFENTKVILNYIGKISRGVSFNIPDFSKLIFPGKSLITPEEVELAVRNKDTRSLQDILLRTSYQPIVKKMVEEMGSPDTLQNHVEEVEKFFYASQMRKKFQGNAFSLGLGFIWQITVEARNLRILAHGIENFTKDEIERRLSFV